MKLSNLYLCIFTNLYSLYTSVHVQEFNLNFYLFVNTSNIHIHIYEDVCTKIIQQSGKISYIVPCCTCQHVIHLFLLYQQLFKQKYNKFSQKNLVQYKLGWTLNVFLYAPKFFSTFITFIMKFVIADHAHTFQSARCSSRDYRRLLLGYIPTYTVMNINNTNIFSAIEYKKICTRICITIKRPLYTN